MPGSSPGDVASHAGDALPGLINNCVASTLLWDSHAT